MIRTNDLNGIIVTRGLSQKDVAKYLGISANTFYSKMKKGVFGSDEIEKMINLLEIKNPLAIFFANDVT